MLFYILKDVRNIQKKNPSFLIVDDAKTIVKVIETVLRKEGFTNLHTAFTPAEALSFVETKSISIIILDVMLPDYNGFKLLKLRDIINTYILFLMGRARIKAYLRRTNYKISLNGTKNTL